MYAGAFAALYAIEHGYTDLDIYYDYIGIEHWATGRWKRRSELAVQYGLTMERLSEQVNITYHKVFAHKGDLFNDLADQLAKRACEEYGRELDEADKFLLKHRKR